MRVKDFALPVVIVLGVPVAFLLWYAYGSIAASEAMRNYSPTPSKTCREGYIYGMTPQEISEMMQIPLIEFGWLPPDIVGNTPEIYPHGLPHFDDSGDVTCVIRVEYPTMFADILSPQMKQPISGQLNCYPYEYIENSARCWGELETTNGLSAVSVFLNYPVATAQKIADSIEVINYE